jgi:uncharacterized protein YhfF
VAEWRAGHESFWHSAQVREELDDPQFTVGDDTLVVAQEFRVVGREHAQWDPSDSAQRDPSDR